MTPSPEPVIDIVAQIRIPQMTERNIVETVPVFAYCVAASRACTKAIEVPILVILLVAVAIRR